MDFPPCASRSRFRAHAPPHNTDNTNRRHGQPHDKQQNNNIKQIKTDINIHMGENAVITLRQPDGKQPRQFRASQEAKATPRPPRAPPGAQLARLGVAAR